jgi:hypothetical protein
MAAGLRTGYSLPMQGVSPIGYFVVLTDQNDFILLDDYKGVFLLESSFANGARPTITRAKVAVNNAGTPYTATDTTIVYEGGNCNRSADAFYMRSKATGEIMEVIDDTPTTATGTLTVKKRGCFGTTAAAASVADEVELQAMNAFLIADATVMLMELTFINMTEDRAGPRFA